MSLALFLVDALPAADTFVLDGPEGHHAADVQRMRVGERLMLGDGAGATATAEVTAVARGNLTLSIVDRVHMQPPSPRLVVAQGLPKGDRGELAVQAMTEVGVDEIVPWAAARCVTVWRDSRGAKAREKWVATAREAAKQARRPWIPAIGPAAVTTAALANRPAAATFVLHEGAATPLTAVDLPTDGDITLVIGPEGGISDEELATFTAAGATAVRLGDSVLRTSTAGVAAICVLSARLSRW